MMSKVLCTLKEFSALYELIDKTFTETQGSDSLIKAPLIEFYKSYEKAITIRQAVNPLSEKELAQSIQALTEYICLIKKESERKAAFGHYHTLERTPYDYYQFGLHMAYPLIDLQSSALLGIDNLPEINQALLQKENIIFLSNHQTEIDPQVISLLVEKESPFIAEKLVCVAGHRVTSDPFAIPFSKGRNLICIYSKKYIEHPPELKAEKLTHNSISMAKLEELLHQGGTCIYIAPSGGRDRYVSNSKECVPTAFDPQSIEMFRLLSKKARKPTHLHLMALHTIDILPPPENVNIQLGEERVAQYNSTGVFFGPRLDPLALEKVGKDLADKTEKRKYRAEYLTHEMRKMYCTLREAIRQNSYRQKS